MTYSPEKLDALATQSETMPAMDARLWNLLCSLHAFSYDQSIGVLSIESHDSPRRESRHLLVENREYVRTLLSSIEEVQNGNYSNDDIIHYIQSECNRINTMMVHLANRYNSSDGKEQDIVLMRYLRKLYDQINETLAIIKR